MPVFTITRVSTGAGGLQGDGVSFSGAFTPDGRSYVFGSQSTNLVAGDTNGAQDLFLKNLTTGAIDRVSTDGGGGQLNNVSLGAAFLDANRFVFVSSASNAVAGDGNGAADVFVKNIQSNVVTLVSSSAAGVIGNAGSGTADTSFGSIAAGDLVVFSSTATNLVAGDSNGVQDIFVKNILTGAITRVSTNSAGLQSVGANAFEGRISSNANLVLFQSSADDLVAGDTNAQTDVFMKDLTTGVTTRVSTAAGGVQAVGGASGSASFSLDGTKVIFTSSATNLVAGDTNAVQDVFIKTLATGAIERVSLDANGGQLNVASEAPSFSPDGTRVIFHSAATNAVPGDTNATFDVFIKTLAGGDIERVSVTPTGTQGNLPSQFGVFTPGGSQVLFLSRANNLVPDDSNGSQDVFIVNLVAPPPAPLAPVAGTDDDGGLAPRADIFDAVGTSILRYLSPTLQPLAPTVVTPTGQILPNPLIEQRNAVLAMAPYDSGVANTQDAIDRIVDMADATTAVAVMNYQFFTGRIPLETGLDFLVNSASNGADLNDGYYGAMSIENRFINFAVNLGKLGAGAAAFNTGYGALALDAATSKAYAEIFGVTPSAAKVAAILTPARQAYLTALGGDAIGTKAAMVGYLLAEAAKSDLGTYAVMNENFLYDLADGVAAFGADAHIYLGAGPRSVSLVGLG